MCDLRSGLSRKRMGQTKQDFEILWGHKEMNIPLSKRGERMLLQTTFCGQLILENTGEVSNALQIILLSTCYIEGQLPSVRYCSL